MVLCFEVWSGVGLSVVAWCLWGVQRGAVGVVCGFVSCKVRCVLACCRVVCCMGPCYDFVWHGVE